MPSTSAHAVAHTINSETPDAEDSFVRVYESYFRLLTSIAVQKFRVPETEAESLAHEVFLKYLRSSATITDIRGWLIGAICHVSRHYWRLNERLVKADDEIDFDRIDPSSTRMFDTLPDQIAAREALERLTPRCQEVLRLRYFEGRSMQEIADYFGVKTKYAYKMVSKCLRRAQLVANAKDVTESMSQVESEQTSPSESLSEALEYFGKAYREVV